MAPNIPVVPSPQYDPFGRLYLIPQYQVSMREFNLYQCDQYPFPHTNHALQYPTLQQTPSNAAQYCRGNLRVNVHETQPWRLQRDCREWHGCLKLRTGPLRRLVGEMSERLKKLLFFTAPSKFSNSKVHRWSLSLAKRSEALYIVLVAGLYRAFKTGHFLIVSIWCAADFSNLITFAASVLSVLSPPDGCRGTISPISTFHWSRFSSSYKRCSSGR